MGVTLCRTLYGCVNWNRKNVWSWRRKKQSHPLRVRELKLRNCRKSHLRTFVAPFTGAWIETPCGIYSRPLTPSRTLYGCVNWNLAYLPDTLFLSVAPFTGAWIETLFWEYNKKDFIVAPFTGAWIETYLFYTKTFLRSRTLYGCVNWNAYNTVRFYSYIWSHPLRVRELKLVSAHIMVTGNRRTLYGCVNWNRGLISHIPVNCVAPFTGAWIETE